MFEWMCRGGSSSYRRYLMRVVNCPCFVDRQLAVRSSHSVSTKSRTLRTQPGMKNDFPRGIVLVTIRCR